MRKTHVSQKHLSPAVQPDQSSEPVSDDSPLDRTVVNSADRAFLTRVMRFLVTIQTRQYAGRARREGYRPKEHALGWKLWNAASGQDRPFDHWVVELSDATWGNSELVDKLRQVDAFENTWYPRVRAILRRVVSVQERDAFEAAFFQGLTQQPLGPSVVGSVSGLLSRISGLAKSSHPEAGKVLAVLTERGLNDATLKAMNALLQDLEKGLQKVEESSLREEILKAQDKQTEAMRQLHDWFADWATTLRTVFGSQECVSLGLSVVRRTASGGEEVVNDDVTTTDPAPAPTTSNPTAPTR